MSPPTALNLGDETLPIPKGTFRPAKWKGLDYVSSIGIHILC